MEETIKLIVLEHYNLISKIEEIPVVEIADPNCKLTDPYSIIGLDEEDKTMIPFLMGFTRDTEIMISSDKILTIADPAPTLLEKYLDLIKE